MGRIACLVSSLMGIGLAMTLPAAKAEVDPIPYVTESGIAIVPMVTLGYKHDDNITLSQSDEESSGIVVLEPGVTVVTERGLSRYSAYYQLKVGEYLDSSIDDYLDHVAGVSAKLDLAVRHRVNLDYRFAYQHEGRGSGISEGIGGALSELLYVRSNDVDAVYSFGSQGAQGRLDFALAWKNKQYTKLEELTRFRNWQELGYGVTFFYRVSSATELLFEIKRKEREYDVLASSGLSRDNDDTFYYLGAQWDVTGKTTGHARIGYEDKRYDSDERENFDGISWQIGLDYVPVAHAKISLETSRAAKDPDQNGDYVDEALYRVTWEHYWLDRFSSRLGYAYRDESYTGVERDDTTDQFSVSVAYDFRRWLELRAGWELADKSSTRSGIGYQQNVFFLTLTGTL